MPYQVELLLTDDDLARATKIQSAGHEGVTTVEDAVLWALRNPWPVQVRVPKIAIVTQPDNPFDTEARLAGRLKPRPAPKMFEDILQSGTSKSRKWKIDRLLGPGGGRHGGGIGGGGL